MNAAMGFGFVIFLVCVMAASPKLFATAYHGSCQPVEIISLAGDDDPCIAGQRIRAQPLDLQGQSIPLPYEIGYEIVWELGQ